MALARLILVTGKGGTGKSTVAAALALCLARRHPTLLVDLDQRMWAARMLGVGSGNDLDPIANLDAIANLETTSLSASTELQALIQRIVPTQALAPRTPHSPTL